MNIIQAGLTLILVSAPISSAGAEWTERREGNVVIIGPAPPDPAKEAERLARERQKRAEEEQRRKQNAAAAQGYESADDWDQALVITRLKRHNRAPHARPLRR